MKNSVLIRFALLLLVFGSILGGGIATIETVLGQNVRAPQTGGQLPQDLDTLSPLLTASTTHTQAGALLCNQTICVVGTANASDAIALRQCTIAPMRQLVANISANTIQVYGSGTDTINGVATATGVAQPKMTTTIQSGVVEYVCVVGGPAAQWVTH